MKKNGPRRAGRTDPEDLDYRYRQAKRILIYAAIGMILFTTVGVSMQIAYYTLAPAGSFYQINEVTVCDATTDDPSATVIYNRTASQSLQGSSVLTLVHEYDNGRTEPVDTRTNDAYIERGKRSLQFEYQLPPDIEPGTYYLQAIIYYDMPYGIDRSASERTGTFEVVNASSPGEPMNVGKPECRA